MRKICRKPGDRFAAGLQQTPNLTTIDDVPAETIDSLASGLDAAGIGRIP